MVTILKHVHVVVNFYFLNSLAYITMPKNDGNIKINCSVYTISMANKLNVSFAFVYPV